MSLKEFWARIVDSAGTPVFFGILTGFMMFFFLRKGLIMPALIFLFAYLGTVAIVVLVKFGFNTARPEDATLKLSSYAFPSGHTAMGAYFITTTLLTLWGVVSNNLYYFIAFVGVSAALLVAASRVMLRVHTPFQVIAGALVGIGIPLLVVALI